MTNTQSVWKFWKILFTEWGHARKKYIQISKRKQQRIFCNTFLLIFLIFFYLFTVHLLTSLLMSKIHVILILINWILLSVRLKMFFEGSIETPNMRGSQWENKLKDTSTYSENKSSSEKSLPMWQLWSFWLVFQIIYLWRRRFVEAEPQKVFVYEI